MTKIIRFNKKIYSEKMIKKTIKSYAHLAKFSFNRNKNYFLVKINPVRDLTLNGVNKTGLDARYKLSDEFSNYVLSLMKK